MRIYLDDCADSNLLVQFLREGGHEVVTPRAAGGRGLPDDEHREWSAANGLVLLTKNPSDFRALHRESQAGKRSHPGILLVYQDNVKGKDMEAADIASAIRCLEESDVPVPNGVHVLNHWRKDAEH